jgi:energy-coupling factor transporter ATP-binding protein EcfA2
MTLGVGHLGCFNEDLFLRDYGRYASLISGAIHKSSMGTTSSSQIQAAYAESCRPGLVSFVGQTGAGKSTLVRMLIKTATHRYEKMPIPIAGSPGQDLSTTAGIHLYADPNTIGSTRPILYADSQGLEGGSREPVATKYRLGRLASGSSQSHVQSVERHIIWANDDLRRSTDFAVTHLYPRILFTFSDVVLFIHRNPR